MSPVVTILSPVMTDEQRQAEWEKVQKVVWEILRRRRNDERPTENHQKD
jgi:hypothetical protein